MHWRRKWQATPVLLPGESQGRGGLVGCRLWGRTESDTTEATYQQQQQQPINKFSLFSSVQFSHSVVSDSLQPHESKHTRPPCPSPTPGVCSWSKLGCCHPTVSSSVVPFFSCSQSFPASGSFPVSQFFTSGGRIIGTSALASVLPVNIQD